jgi:hypothetical protein
LSLIVYPVVRGSGKRLGDFAPKLVSLTADVLFGDTWRAREFHREIGA